MKRKQKKRPSVRETPEFQELAKELRKQVPDRQKKLQDLLDEVIGEKNDNPDEK